MDTKINKYGITITFKHNNYDQTLRKSSRNRPKISKILKSKSKKVAMNVTKNAPTTGARSAPALRKTSELGSLSEANCCLEVLNNAE